MSDNRNRIKGAPWPDREVTPAYEHGRRNGVGDRTGSVDWEQRLLARDHQTLERLRAVLSREWKP
jgi:hypothetical protein